MGAFPSCEPPPGRLELSGPRFVTEVENWSRTDAREGLVGRPVVDAESFGARLLLLTNPLDKSALGEPVELCAVIEASLSSGVVGDNRAAVVEIVWEGGEAETLKTGSTDDVDACSIEVEILNSEAVWVVDAVKIEVLWSDCTRTRESATVELCIGNAVRERREVDTTTVPEELELIASCEGINVLECAPSDGIVVLVGRMVKVGKTTTRLVSDGGGNLDV